MKNLSLKEKNYLRQALRPVVRRAAQVALAPYGTPEEKITLIRRHLNFKYSVFFSPA